MTGGSMVPANVTTVWSTPTYA